MFIPGSNVSIPQFWYKKDRSPFTAVDTAQLLHMINILGHRSDGTQTMQPNEIAFYQDGSPDNSAVLQLNEARDALRVTSIKGHPTKLPGVLMQVGLIHSV